MSSMENDQIELDHDTAALVIKSDGTIQLYIPKGSGSEVPPHAEAVVAIASYWVEHHEEVLRWFAERVNH